MISRLLGRIPRFKINSSFRQKILYSPLDVPSFPLKMQIFNRLLIDAHYLFGLENALTGYDWSTVQRRIGIPNRHLTQKNQEKAKVIATVLENIPHNNEGIWGRKEYKKKQKRT